MGSGASARGAHKTDPNPPIPGRRASLQKSRTHVILDEAKHGYLISEKLGKMKKAGLAEADRTQIEQLIKQKVSNSYIYNLVYLEDHDVMKFNIMLELEREGGYPTRMTAALEYMPNRNALRVITLH